VGEARTRVLVTVEIDGSIPIRDKDEPKVTKGLTGNVFMDIVPHKRRTPEDTLGEPLVTTAQEPLTGYHYPSIEELAERVEAVIIQVQETMVQVQADLKTFDRTLGNFEQASTDVRDITGRVQKSVERNDKTVDDILTHANAVTETADSFMARLKPDVLEVVRNARETVVNSRTKVEAMLLKMTDMVDKLDQAAGDVRVASADVRATTDQARELVVANRPDIDATIDEIRQGAARLNLGMEDIRRNPWKLLSRNIEADPYTQNIYDASMSFAEGARALSIASANLSQLLSRDEIDESTVKESAERINRLLDEMANLEKLLFEAMKSRPK
jgi:ABC-type transporter Mla subunit MlaD